MSLRLFSSRNRRPRYGDPKLTAEYWTGVMSNPVDMNERLDGVVHIRERTGLKGPTYFFRGIFLKFQVIFD